MCNHSQLIRFLRETRKDLTLRKQNLHLVIAFHFIYMGITPFRKQMSIHDGGSRRHNNLALWKGR